MFIQKLVAQFVPFYSSNVNTLTKKTSFDFPLKFYENFHSCKKHLFQALCSIEDQIAKKAVQVGLFVLALLSPFSLFSQEVSETFYSNGSKPVILSELQGKEWVELSIKQHPEILWLADEKVRETKEGVASSEEPYSKQLFGKTFIEFDRTIMTLHCLRLIIDGKDSSYLEFTAAQPEEVKLSRESFQKLHEQGQNLLKSKWHGLSEIQIAEVMETALVLGDMGKSEKARELFKPYGAKAPDHDDLYGEAMQVIKSHPHLRLCPSFDKLPIDSKELLFKISNLAHYGHVTHLEGGSAMFSKLRQSEVAKEDPFALSFDLFVHTCDVAGALGHLNNKSSKVYTELSHLAMQAMADSVRVLSDSSKTEWDAYNAYLDVRSSWLGLNSTDKEDRVLARIGAMLRLFTREEGLVLRKAMLSLSEGSRNKIAAQLDVQKTDPFNRTPTYMPAVLINLFNNPILGKTKEERLSFAITLGLPFIARVLEEHKELLLRNKIDLNIPLNFNEMAGVAKGISPESLNGNFYINEEGSVLLGKQNI